MNYRIITLAVTLMAATLITAVAQTGSQLIVRDFHHDQNDLTANRHGSMRKDQNGQTAALIKIYTTVEDLSFDGGISGITSVERLPGEYRVYIPEKSRKILIRHPKYGVLEYTYAPEVIRSAATYLMRLDLDGREVSLETSVPQTEIILDGKSIGLSPQTLYLPYGLVPVIARNGNMVFDGNVMVEREGNGRIIIPMVDETENWGKVRVTTDPAASIYYNGSIVGANGEWNVTLPPGGYSVETRDPFDKADPQTTTFTVEAKSDIEVQALPPTPHVGYLNIELTPVGTTVKEGGTVLSSDGGYTFPVGRHELTFEYPGYYPQSRVYEVTNRVRENSVVTLKQIQYAKSSTIYASIGGTYCDGIGASVAVGGIFSNVDFSASFTLGFSSSDPVKWFDIVGSEEVYNSVSTYKVNMFAIRAGYQIHVTNRLAITPYLGYLGQMLTGGENGDGLMSGGVMGGVKLYYVPVQHFGIFLSPEYATAMQGSDLAKKIAEAGGLTRGGFSVSAGVVFNL